MYIYIHIHIYIYTCIYVYTPICTYIYILDFQEIILSLVGLGAVLVNSVDRFHHSSRAFVLVNGGL